MLISLTIMQYPSHTINSQSNNLSNFSFLVRGSIEEMLKLTYKKISTNVNTSDFQIIQHQFDKKACTFFVKIFNDNLHIACVDCKYPLHIAFHLLLKMMTVLLKTLIKEYSDYTKIDLISAVNEELDETKVVLTRALEVCWGEVRNWIIW